MYSVEIKKESLPYSTKLNIVDNIFNLSFNYNLYDERVYCTLSDVDDNILAEDEPIVLGQILFARYYIDDAGNFKETFPKAVIIPNFIDSANVGQILYNNINEAVLYVEENI